MSGKKTSFFLISFCFLLLLILRLIHLSADPPYDLSTSGAPYGDPGGYSFNARNKILFGTWEIDDYNMMYLSFPPHLVTFISFELFGTGISQQNLVPVLFSFGSLILIFLLLRERFNEIAALLGTGLLGVNYLFLMYSRIANRVMPPIFFILFGIYLLNRRTKRRWSFIGAGMLFFLAFISKSVVFYILGAVFTGYLISAFFQYRIKDIAKQLWLILIGILLVFLPWFFFIYLPQKEYIHAFTQLNMKYLIPSVEPSLIMRYFWTRPPILLKEMPMISILAAISSLIFLYKICSEPKKVKSLDWIFLIWYFAGFFYFAIIQQRVTRHFIPQIIPLVFLSVSLGYHLLQDSKLKANKKSLWIFSPLFFLWALFPASLLLKYISSKFPRLFQGQQSLNLTLLCISILFTFFSSFSLKAGWKSEKIFISLGLKKFLLFLFLAAFFIFHVYKYLHWAHDPPYQLKEISQDYGKAFDCANIAGLWAPVICLENKHRAYEYFQGIINDYKDFFERYRITHVFTTTAFDENLIFERNFPLVMHKAELLARYHIWTTEVLLYDANPVKKIKHKGLFESELYTQKGSTPRFDPNASEKFAVLCRSRQAKFVALVNPMESFSKGRYEVTFRMRKQGDYKKLHERIARLDIVSERQRKVLGYKNLFPQDLASEGYRLFTLTINVKRQQNLTFRVYTQGNGAFWIDWIQIKKLD